MGTDLQLAAASWVGQFFDGNFHNFVFVAFDFTQVDVLHRVARLGQGELAAWAVDLGSADCVAHSVFLADVAVDGFQAGVEHLSGIVALHGVDVK